MRVIISRPGQEDIPIGASNPPCVGAYPYEVDITEDSFQKKIDVWVVELHSIVELFTFIQQFQLVGVGRFKWNERYFHIEIQAEENDNE